MLFFDFFKIYSFRLNFCFQALLTFQIMVRRFWDDALKESNILGWYRSIICNIVYSVACQDLQFKKSTPNDRFLKNLFLAIFGNLLSQSFYQKSVAKRNIILYFVFYWGALTRELNRVLTSNKPTHNLLQNGYYINHK